MRNSNGKFVLDENGDPVPEPDIYRWGKWMEDGQQRHLARTEFDGGVVSTVFLGLDHGFGNGNPVLWETMIFGGPHDQEQWRYTSRAEALSGHEQAVALATKED